MIAKLKIELMAMVFTSIRRPSARQQRATNATARAGMAPAERTRRKPEKGRPWSGACQSKVPEVIGTGIIPLAKANVSLEAATMRIEQLQIEEIHNKAKRATLPCFPKLLNAI